MTKDELRDQLAGLSVDEKMDILEKLRERELAIREARSTLRFTR